MLIRIALKNKDASVQSVNGAIVNAIRPFLYENTEREPIIIPMILTTMKNNTFFENQQNSPVFELFFYFFFLDF